MKLAEALILRADYAKRIEQLKDRLKNNAKVQENEEPAESPKKLLEEINECISELTLLIQRINKTNASIKFEDNRTLADALAEREMLWDKRNIYHHFAEALATKHDRYSLSEVKIVSTYNEEKIRKLVDDISKEYRLLDMKIQGLNWTIDLI